MRSYLIKNCNGIHANVDQSVCHIISYLNQSVCHIAISNSNVDFAFHCIHATFLIQIHMYMMNTMVVRKLLDGFKHMTYKIAQQIEPMSTFRNLVWHEFEIITRMPGPRFKSYNVHRIETSILSLVLSTFKCCFQPPPPPPAHTLHTSCIGQSSSPNHLRKLSVSNTRSFFLSMFRSLSLSTTQPLFPPCYQMYLPHTPAIAPHAELSLSPLSLSPSRAKYMHCLSSPPTSRAHARTLYIQVTPSRLSHSFFRTAGHTRSISLSLSESRLTSFSFTHK